MLQGLVKRATKAGLAPRIDVRLSPGEHLGVEDYADRVDFALAFAMVHEAAHPEVLLADIRNALKPGGRLLFAEPVGHVTDEAFALSLDRAKSAGLVLQTRPTITRCHSAVLVRA